VEDLSLIDELMANAWPPAVVEHRGGWRYRWTHGVTRRANSALVRADKTMEGHVDRAEAFYRARAAPTLIQVSTASAPAGLAPLLERRGYLPEARTLVLHAPTGDVLRHQGSSVDRTPLEVALAATADDGWFDAYWAVESTRGRGHGDAVVCRNVLLATPLSTCFVSVHSENAVVGVGQLVVEQGWGGVQCMATQPSHRRRGIAAAALRALAREAHHMGAQHLYLGVVAANVGARHLYEAAGFQRSHEYRYYREGAGSYR
jgi:GNAT superfamily N-acetyltransferase